MLYVVEQGGLIRVVKAGKIQPQPFLDVRRRVAGGRRAGPARARVRPRLRDEPAVRRQLHGPQRRHAGRALPLERHEGAARQREAAALRRPAVPEPQRRHGRLRPGRPALRRHGRRRLGRRSREPGPEPGLAARQDPPARSRHARHEAGHRRARRPQSMAVLVRPRRTATSGSATSARARSRRSTTSPGRGTGSSTSAGTSTRDAPPSSSKPLGPGRLVQPVAQYSHQRGCSITGGYVYRGVGRAGSRAATSTATTAAGTIWSLKLVGSAARADQDRAVHGREPDVVRRGQRRRALRRLGQRHAVPPGAVIPVCATCGAWFPDGPAPRSCPICEDERQWVPEDGQRWTTADERRRGPCRRRARCRARPVGRRPRAVVRDRPATSSLVESPAGNIAVGHDPGRHRRGRCGRPRTWPGDRRSRSLTRTTTRRMSAWSEALGDVPILLHAADRAARHAAVRRRSSTGTETSCPSPVARR